LTESARGGESSTTTVEEADDADFDAGNSRTAQAAIEELEERSLS
jgi:hypothetical protein